MTAPRFVRLTMADGSERPVDINPAAISAIIAEWESGRASIDTTIHIYGTCFSVTETRDEILALLAAPAPSVEVTESVLDAAWAAYDDAASTGRDSMRAAIEAADRARGLRG